jgi:nicotinate-nucleotide adenylyltransferase
MKIAILGGAFNPVTLGHAQIARCVLDSVPGIDEVWLMPCYRHMYNKEMVAAGYRLAMCRIACAGMAAVRVSDYEIASRVETGTYYVMQKLLADPACGKGREFSLIIGQDNANTFNKWIRHDLLEKLVSFIVIPRQGISRDPDVTWYLKPPHFFLDRDKPVMEVSSTLVRSLLAENRTEEALRYIHPDVLEYIKKNSLYTDKA